MAPVLEVAGLVKHYGTHRALDGVSLQIEAGEIFALLGPNGAGKTTLIGAACGLVRKTSGTIKIFGLDLDQDPISPRYRIGLVPQEINFDPFFTVRESLRIQQGYFGQNPDDARIDELLAALSLTSKAEAQTRQLSGGMKRRLLIAKALVHRPTLVFLDEPTAGVDVELRRDLWTYVRKLKAEGTTVVLTTHYLEEAEELADRVGIIDQGQLLLLEEKHALMKRLGERTLTVRFTSRVAALPPGVEGVLAADQLSFSFTERTGTQTSAEVDVAMLAIGVGLIVPALVTTMVLTSYDPARDSQSSAGEDAEADEIPRTEDGTSTEAVQVEESGESTGSEAAPASDGAAAPAPSSRLERTGTSLMAGGPGLLRFDGTRVLLGVPMVQRLATFTAEEARTLRVTQSADVNVPVLSASF